MNNDHPSQLQPATPVQADSNADREHRRRMFKAGIVSYQNGSLTCDATVKDLTSMGAKLQIDNKQIVPDKILLTIPVDGVSIECEVRWRCENKLGVGFIGEWENCGRNARVQSVDINNIIASKPTLRKAQ